MLIGALITAIGSAIDGFFKSKETQAATIRSTAESGVEGISTLSSADAEAAKASGKTVHAEITSDHWLAAMWRPLLMVTFAIIIVTRWFGFEPSHITIEEVNRLYDLLELGITGYIGGRTLEKIVRIFVNTPFFKKLLERK